MSRAEEKNVKAVKITATHWYKAEDFEKICPESRSCNFFPEGKIIGYNNESCGLLVYVTEEEEVKIPKELPSLIGSPKQISWASQLREKIIAIRLAELNSEKEYAKVRGVKRKHELKTMRFEEAVKNNSAKFFIENRKEIEKNKRILEWA